MSTDTALVIIDVQNGLIEDAFHRDEVLDAIKTLLARAHASETPVIYVQHNDEELETGTPPWYIHPSIAPHKDEPVVHKQACDSFHNTTFQRELAARGIKHLVVAGEQTQYCIDTTVRRAITMGYDVVLVSDAHTTFDNNVLTAAQIIAHTNDTLNGFATNKHKIVVKPAREITFSQGRP